MEKPLVSVIMPSYNHAEYVGRAIESVLNQTYSNFEFIIADDGSTDGSPEVIEQYHDPRISFTRFEENTGFGASEYIYNKAKGKYIAAICSDDMWKNTLLEKYVSFLEENNSYVCCFCRPEIVDENDNVIVVDTLEEIFYAENQKKEEWFKDFYTRGNCICAFDKLGSLRFQFRQLQDFEYWMRLVQIGNIYISRKTNVL